MNDIENEMPKSVDEAVDIILSSLSMRDKIKIADMPDDELIELHNDIGMEIRNDFSLWYGNEELMESCRKIAGKDEIMPEHASFIIVMEVWEKLQTEDLLRVVK